MKIFSHSILLVVMLTSTTFGQLDATTSKSTRPLRFTLEGECDVGVCRFRTLSFKYTRNVSITVGSGDSSLSYYYDVNFSSENKDRSYLYKSKPAPHFIDKSNKKNVDSTLNGLLLDVYYIGMYFINSDIKIHLPQRVHRETGKYAVLKKLRLWHTSRNFRLNLIRQYSILPSEIKAYLNSRHKGWSLYAGDPICRSRPFVYGDFDGDGLRDYAVMFTRGQRGFIFAFLNKRTWYKKYTLESGTAKSLLGTFLVLAQKGGEFAPLINEALGRGPTQQLKQDAIMSGGCESSSYLMVFKRGKWERFWTSD